MEDINTGWTATYLILFFGAGVVLLFAGFLLGRSLAKNNGNPSGEDFGNDAAILNTVVEHAHEGLVMQDIYGRIEWSNPAYSRITGYSAEEIRGRRPQEFVLPPDKQLSPQQLENFRFDLNKFSSGFKELILNRRKDGELFWNQLTFAKVDGETEEKTRMIILCQDVTREVERFAELEETRKRLKYQAEHDELTGLATRAKIATFLQECLSRDPGESGNVGVIHFDLDHFKEINDGHGHSAGDAVLKLVAEVLKSVLQKKGMVARIGGDEFLAVISAPEGPEQMEALAQQIFGKLDQPIMIERQRLKVAGSIGLVLADTQKTSQAELINWADIALYAAKKAGRGRYSWYTEALGAASRHRRTNMALLDQDLENDNLTLLLEPQYDLEQQQITGYEASAHWLHPSEGLVDPAKVLSAQDDTKRIAQIERFALQHGLSEIRRLRDAAGRKITVSVDLTGASVDNPNFAGQLVRLCEEADYPVDDLTIELNERIVRFDEPGSLEDAIEKLSGTGCRIALDEVGGGRGGAGQLIRVNASLVKLSPWLVSDLETNSRKRYLTQSIVKLAGKFDCNVMAVGVERPEQADILRGFGCRFIQGSLVSSPLSAREAEIHLREFAIQEHYRQRQ